jgi:hypothetical protein
MSKKLYIFAADHDIESSKEPEGEKYVVLGSKEFTTITSVGITETGLRYIEQRFKALLACKNAFCENEFVYIPLPREEYDYYAQTDEGIRKIDIDERICYVSLYLPAGWATFCTHEMGTEGGLCSDLFEIESSGELFIKTDCIRETE